MNDPNKEFELSVLSGTPTHKTKIIPYYEEPGITIYCADCRDVIPQLEPVGLILTDPQYGIDHPTDYKTRGRENLAACSDYQKVHDDDKPFDPSHLPKIPMILWGANYYTDKLPVSSGWLVWDKGRPPDLDQATVELAWTNFVKGARIFHYLWHGMIRAGDEKMVHPTQKPVALMKWCLNLKWTPPGTVLDPYMGSGPVIRAAKDLGRKAIGIEIEEKYCEIAVERLRQGVLI
jgi:site-specific DNA-methyltransferase (adenine-specific)